MKLYEQKCVEYAKKWKDNWEYHCLVKDAWLTGFQIAREDLLKELSGTSPDTYVSVQDVLELINNLEAQEV